MLSVIGGGADRKSPRAFFGDIAGLVLMTGRGGF